jgi:hypothetical protein
MEDTSWYIDEASIVFSEKPKLKNPILIEGLPGVGNVGKLAAEHLIDEIGATKFADIYSTDFPPQVFVRDDGTVELARNELYYWKGSVDLIILTGDYQGLSTRGQYILVQSILQLVQEYGTKRIYTLGGYGVGVEVEEPTVTGAATHPELIEELEEYGIVFKDKGGGGIVGASGLLLGIGKMMDMEGVCLMGETSGYMVDPGSAREVLKTLAGILDIDIGFAKLEEKAEEISKIAQRIKQLEQSSGGDTEAGDLNYIG